MSDERILNCAICKATLSIRYLNEGEVDPFFKVERNYHVILGEYVCELCKDAISKLKEPSRKIGETIKFNKELLK